MQVECSVRLVTLLVRNSFKYFIPSIVYLGSKARNPLEPVLILVTSNVIIEFKVCNNVRRIYKKEINYGRIGVEFYVPPHQLLIKTNSEKLFKFLELFHKLMDRRIMENLENIPTIRQLTRPNSEFKPPDIENVTVSGEVQDNCMNTIKTCTVIPLDIKNRLSKHLRDVDLPSCNLKRIPVELGLTSVQYINLENNDLRDCDLMWLQELPIRKSLNSLNLSENKIMSFPSVLIDYNSLILLNLRDNAIEFIPNGIHQLRCLKYLNLSGNNIKFLPANFNLLKLSEADLTYNYLTNNVRSDFRPEYRGNSKNCLRLADLAAINVDPGLRRELTYRHYPKTLLDKLRSLSKCGACDGVTIPNPSSQFYEMLLKIRFALTYKIHPQKCDFLDAPLYGIRRKGDGKGNIFLQYHFCNKCEDEYMQYCPVDSDHICYRLSQ